MIVTDKKYHLETKLVEKLELMIGRMGERQKKDNLLLVEGSEGDGKTNASIAIAYYVSQRTGRKFTEENIYFDVEKMVNVAKNSEKQILIWDEPALSGLTVEWWKKAQINLVKLLMIARKKRHFFIFNFTKFFKFNEYIVLDRAIGMVHVYSRYTKTGSIEQGRFAYFKKSSLEQLYYYWRSTKRRAYKKYKDFNGHFPWVLPNLINEDKYEDMKDEAILTMGNTEKSKSQLKLLAFQYLLATFPNIIDGIKAKHFGVSRPLLTLWREIPKKHPEVNELLRKSGDSKL